MTGPPHHRLAIHSADFGRAGGTESSRVRLPTSDLLNEAPGFFDSTFSISLPGGGRFVFEVHSITQLKAQGPSRICNESKEEEGWKGVGFSGGVWCGVASMRP